MPEIKQDTLDLAKQLKAVITIGENGQATIKEGSYVKMLPADLTEANIKSLQAHNSQLISAGALAVGEMGIDYFKKHKSIDRIELSIPAVGKDTIDFTLDRSKKVNTPGSTDQTTTYGAIAIKHSVYSTKPRGELAKVKTHLAELAMKAIGEK